MEERIKLHVGLDVHRTACIGVDVSKAELVMAIGSERLPCGIENDAASIARWLRRIPSHALIAMESTALYHMMLAHLAREVRFNDRFHVFCRYWKMTPRACAPYRAQTKGKDERGVGYVTEAQEGGGDPSHHHQAPSHMRIPNHGAKAATRT